MDLDLAMELGRMYRGDASQLPAPIPEDISSVLNHLDASFTSLEGMYDFVCNTTSLDNATLVAFFAQFPMDNVFLLLREHPERLLYEAWVHDMLRTIQTALRMHTTHSHRFCERFVVGLPIVDAVRRLTGSAPPSCLNACIDLLVFTCCTCRDLVRDRTLFRNLATFIEYPQHREKIMFLLEAGELYEETPLVEDLFVSCVSSMARRSTGDVLQWMERMLRFNTDLRTERYVIYTSELWRTGWPVQLGPVVAHLLDTSNVALIIGWERYGKLQSLIHASLTHKTIEWRAVRGLLVTCTRRACVSRSTRHTSHHLTPIGPNARAPSRWSASSIRSSSPTGTRTNGTPSCATLRPPASSLPSRGSASHRTSSQTASPCRDHRGVERSRTLPICASGEKNTTRTCKDATIHSTEAFPQTIRTPPIVAVETAWVAAPLPCFCYQ